MKKCLSCTKDLPDAALHCVFCGAKQPPAPAAQPAAMAKTVMGYGANEELNRLREQAMAQNAARSGSPSAPAPNVPANAPNLGYAATLATPPGAGPAPVMPQNAALQSPAMPGASNAQARTMFVDNSGPPAAAPRPHTPSQPAPLGPMVPGGMPLGGPSPMADVKTFAPDPARMVPAVGAPGGPALPNAASGGYNPQPVGSDAKTIMPAYNPQPVGNAGGNAYNPQPVGNPYTPQPNVYNPTPPVPSATPAYATPSHRPHQASRPIEPWKDTLRTQLFIWGGVLIACFAVPISLSPLVGMWDAVIHGAGTQKLVPLILGAVGLMSVVVGGMPMPSAPRGAIAAVLGLAGIFVPMLVVGSLPEWQSLLSIGGTLLLVPALLVRNEYTESPLPRILITVGALAALAPFLIPQHGSIPLVEMFKLIIDAPGALKVGMLVFVAYVLVLVLSLLAWMPAPATAGAKVLAWVLLLFPLILQGTAIGLSGGEGIDFEHNLNPLVLGWAYGASAGKATAVVGGLGLGSAYVAIASYGLASVIGKKLE